eukprot:Skav224064  [mRNA]  locus=scaffold534:600305:604852:- [translate_table: standard]
MTSIVDSQAHLRQRAQEMGMTDRGLNALVNSGFTTLGKLAFGHGQPGVPVIQTEFDDFAQRTLGALMTVADGSVLKRLLFDGHTLVLSQLKESISNPEASSTRRLPQVEREARMTQLKNNLRGVLIERQMEPSHSLLDLTAQQWESRQLKYISPDKCPSREWEITMMKSSKQLEIDAEKLLVKEKNETPDYTNKTELETFEALRRRGVAYAFADIIQRDGFNAQPVSDALLPALSSYEVGFHLMPLPKPASAPSKPEQPSKSSQPSAPHRNAPYRTEKGKGKNKSKSKGKGATNILPRALQGRDNVSIDVHNRRLCFGFNIHGCPHAKAVANSDYNNGCGNKKKRKAKHLGPVPLRSDKCPNGLPSLSAVAKERVRRANALYEVTAEVVAFCLENNIIVAVENPQYSFMWTTSAWTKVASRMKYCTFHSCQYGSARKKKTMLAYSHPAFAHINLKCPGVSSSHRHKPWGRNATGFATAEETAYPFALAMCIAHAFVVELCNAGMIPPPEVLSQVTQSSTQVLQSIRASTGSQPKASVLPPIVPEFARTVKVTGPVNLLPPTSLGSRLSSDFVIPPRVASPIPVIPKYARLLSLTTVFDSVRGGDMGNKKLQSADTAVQSAHEAKVANQRVKVTTSEQDSTKVESEKVKDTSVSSASSGNPSVTSEKPSPQSVAGKDIDSFSLSQARASNPDELRTQTWQIPWDPLQFIDEAQKAGHPCELATNVPSILKEAVEYHVRTTAAQRAADRASSVKHWLNRAVQLAEDEAALHRTLPAHAQKIVKAKRLLLWKEMLEACDYHDMGVLDEFLHGVDLVGSIPDSGLWPKKFTPAVMTMGDLSDSSRRDRCAIGSRMSVPMEPSVAAAVWEQTQQEVKLGWLSEEIPLSAIPLADPISRRFGIQQGPKVRCIDDFTESSVNLTVESGESPRPHTLDVVAGLILECMHVKDAMGPWAIRTFDLKNAYRQCYMSTKSLEYSCIGALDPGVGRVKFFRMLALPFGSVRSVHSFLRIAHSIWFVCSKLFHILWCNFFDDFVTIAPQCDVRSVTLTIETVLQLLGWTFAQDGKKAPPFASSCTALGVVIDLSHMHLGSVSIDNTPSRKSELSSTISEILDAGSLSKQGALQLRGRMQFSAGQFFGRVARACLGAVTRHAYDSVTAELSSGTIMCLSVYHQILLSDKPRVLSLSGADTWMFFTDACYEPEESGPFAGLGGVLINPAGQIHRFFSHKLTQEHLEALNPKKARTLIFECEFLAVYLALYLWGNLTAGAQVMFFIDNNAVRDNLISCHSNNTVGKIILQHVLSREQDCRINSWFARVPSPSNIADEASRNDLKRFYDLGCPRDSADLDKVLSSLALERGEHQAA